VLATNPPIVVLDTNAVLRALADGSSASADIVRACERRAILILLSKPVLDEYREVLGEAEASGRFAAITPEAIVRTLDVLRYVGEYLRNVRVTFRFNRGPDDARFIELAIAGRASHIISHDADLLSLPTSHTDDGRRFRQRLPRTQVLDSVAFKRSHRHLFADPRGA
jgi:putative PIN family toxin of toxin-antitoxin system